MRRATKYVCFGSGILGIFEKEKNRAPQFPTARDVSYAQKIQQNR